MARTIGVLSIKGGVGKTSAVVSLGDAIAGFGKKVLIVDANFSAPNLGAHLNIIEPEKTIHEVLGRVAKVSEAITKYETFDILPAKIFSNKRISPLDLKKKLGSVKRSYDFILIDSSPSLNEEGLAPMLAADELIIVTTPDVPTLTSTLKLVKIIKQRKIPINGIILNKTHDKDFELSMGNIEDTVDVPILAVIPYDINVLKSVSKFIPSTTHKPNSRSSMEYKKLAATLIGVKYKPFSFREIFKTTPKRHEINREIFYERVFK